MRWLIWYVVSLSLYHNQHLTLCIHLPSVKGHITSFAKWKNKLAYPHVGLGVSQEQGHYFWNMKDKSFRCHLPSLWWDIWSHLDIFQNWIHPQKLCFTLSYCCVRCKMLDSFLLRFRRNISAFLQWFGDLVTMKGWGELWLNEGFATYFENIGATYARPNMAYLETFYSGLATTALDRDALTRSTHPLATLQGDT